MNGISKEDIKIIGYLAEWEDWTAEDVAAEKMTHINYAFAHIRDGVVVGGKVEKFEELKKLKQKHPHLKALISLGGWESDGFSDAALTEESREKFAVSAVAYMKEHGFDGIDLDWEYPCSSEAGIKSRPEDKQNYTQMLKKLREKLDAAGNSDGIHYLMTIATGAMREHVGYIEFDKVSSYLDCINIMTYDLYNGFSTTTGHHANLFLSSLSKEEANPMSAEIAVEEHIKAGVPAHKIVLGCAFYGRGWDVVSKERQGMHQPVASECKEYRYDTLVSEYINKKGYVRHWDEGAKAPYLWNGTTFISYDDPESLGYKVQYIKQKGLGGAMFWEYAQDWTGTLLDKLYTGLK